MASSPLEKKENVSVHSHGDASSQKPDEVDEITPAAAYFKLWSFASPLDVVLRVLAAACSTGSGTAEPLMSIVFGNLVNLFNGTSDVTPEEFRRQVNRNALYLFALFIGKFALVATGSMLWSFTAARMTARIRLRYLKTVLRRPISYFDKRSPGAIASSLATDTNVVQVGLSEKIGIAFQVVGMMVTAFVIALTKQWKVTLVTATIIPYMLLTTGFFGGLNAKTEGQLNEVLTRAAGVAEEALSSILNITAMGAKDKILKRYDVYLKEAKRQSIKMGPLMAAIYGNMFLAIHCGYALSLFYGAKLVARGEVRDAGTIVTVLFCMLIASSSLSFLAPLMPDFSKASGAAQQIVKAIGVDGADDTDKSGESGTKIDSLEGDIMVQNVSFAYPERATVTVLDNMTLAIPRNKSTAIVGHSGSGKSTIIGLLERWYEPNSGTIIVDGKNILDLDLQWWRSQIGLVQQEPVLFNDTILNNVLNGLRGAEAESLTDAQKRELAIEACKQSNAHEFISRLPKGYDTSVGERAGFLSGGQKQRIAIARAIISNPRILLFDEATSALDSESERVVQVALEKVSKGRTTVTIAHKLSTIANADNIVVLSKGLIVEQGTHTELQARDGYYCRLLQAQGSSPQQKEKEETVTEEVELTKKVSRLLSRQATKKTIDEATENVNSPLESTDISRRYGLLHCIYIIYREQKQLIWLSLIGAIAGLAGGAGFPLQAVFFSRLTAVFSKTGSDLIDSANFWALMFFILGLSQLFSYLVLLYVMSVVGARLGAIYRDRYLDAMLRQDVVFFQTGGNSSGGLSALMRADGADMEMLFGSNLALIMVFMTDLVSCAILALACYWKLALVAIFGCLPAIMLAGFMRMRIELGAQERTASSFLETARYSTEAVAAIRTVSSLTMESKVEDMYQQKLSDATASATRTSAIGMLLYALSDSLTLAASALAFWYGGRLLSFQELSSTQFFIIFAAIIFGGQSAGFMFGFTGSINKAHAAMNRILWLTHSKSVINSSTGDDPRTAPPPPHSTPTVEFRDVHFRYPSRPTVPVLKGLSLSAPRGSHICIVGPSGCGKSTVISLIERFYDAGVLVEEKDIACGEINVYGRPIREWDIGALRKMMGLVAQDTTLYQGSIRDNILLGLDEEEIKELGGEIENRVTRACQEANIDEFIKSLPEGYDTQIGARGVALSGGQRQRLALARCLIRNPQILLLDEATSALDLESQRGVREALGKAQRERPGLTVISVTHQVEGMRDADHLFVVDKGVVVEEGRWDVLMERKGRLWGMVVQGQVEG